MNRRFVHFAVSLCFLVLPHEACGLSIIVGKGEPITHNYDLFSRRSALSLIASYPGIATLFGCVLPVLPAKALEEDLTSATTTKPLALSKERETLLSSIGDGADDSVVLDALENLVRLDPSNGKGATYPDRLDGEWKLLWSAKAEAFSPLLRLPTPLRPSSYQYLGDVAASEVGPNRVAQGLTGGILSRSQIWLSSGVSPSATDESVLDILPPFRLQWGGRVGSGRDKTLLVESNSDAEFRANAINSRSVEAQSAPPNQYRQLYVEAGGKGSLRISSVISGDPVIVGAIFVHQKI